MTDSDENLSLEEPVNRIEYNDEDDEICGECMNILLECGCK